MEIKVLDKWNNKLYGSNNTIYQFENGVRLTVAVYPTTNEFVMHVLVKGGSYLEDRIGVPHGTAHFVEHLLCNPNSELKTFDELDHYRFGNTLRPSIGTNAYTSVQNIVFYGYTHIAGMQRLIDYLQWIIDYPSERLTEFIEAERKIILAEESREKKEDRSKGLHFVKFLLKDKYPEYKRRLIGKAEEIQQITIEDIKKYISNVFIPENIMLTVQTDKAISKTELKKYEKLAEKFTKNKKDKKVDFKYKRDVLENDYAVTHFKDTDYQNVYILMFGVLPEIEGRNLTPEQWRITALRDLLQGVIGYRLFKHLRENKKLVYNADTYTSYATKEWLEFGVEIECQVENLVEVLEELNFIVDTDIEAFLQSKEGKLWLTNYVSGLIFKPNVLYSRDYARNVGLDILREITPYKMDPPSYKKAIKSITLEDLMEFYQKSFKNQKMRFWSYSPYEDEVIIDAIKESRIGMSMAKLNNWISKAMAKVNGLKA